MRGLWLRLTWHQCIFKDTLVHYLRHMSLVDLDCMNWHGVSHLQWHAHKIGTSCMAPSLWILAALCGKTLINAWIEVPPIGLFNHFECYDICFDLLWYYVHFEKTTNSCPGHPHFNEWVVLCFDDVDCASIMCECDFNTFFYEVWC